ncbi:MAG: glucose-6-phosphate isomerase [Defluviitaleaceae bacterium]|nr:glucose-6-phosphate isomerase [Defluviitaleaceae bacterium]
MERIRLDYNNMMQSQLGAEGFTREQLEKFAPEVAKAACAIAKKRSDGSLAWMDLPYSQNGVVKEIKDYANSMKGKAEAFVVLGIGGSALGPIAVQQALNHPCWNELTQWDRGGWPKLYVEDNVDPERLSCLFDVIDISKSLFNVITKSGSTSETMSQFMIIKELLENKLGKEGARERIVCTTDKAKGNLAVIARDEGYKTFIVPDGVGGRFSELCPVGLLPAAFCGIDIEGLLEGAAEMDARCKGERVFDNPAALFALLHFMGMKKGKNITVMMPYADSLKFVGDWFAQLWAESLGKRFDASGKEAFTGQTPVRALGATDQHSQVQLYAEGPFDKIVVFLGADEFKRTVTIPKLYSEMPSLGFLGGFTHNELIEAERKATEYALTKAGRMNMTLSLPRVDAKTVGQLLYMLEVATAFAGEFLNIDAFDQPGVEEGKNATYALFGRPGYEDKKLAIEEAFAKDADYVCQ